MDYLEHAVILALDSVILAVCYHQYQKHKQLASNFKEVYERGVNPSIEDVRKNADNGDKRAVVMGTVKATKGPIRSVNSYSKTGVIQKLTVKERALARGVYGYWSEHDSLIDETYSFVPFQLKNGKYTVKVEAPLEAEYLALDIIEDRFEPSLTGFMEHFFGLVVGIHRRGIQYTEYMLREDTSITGFGELVITDNGSLQLQPPSDGSSYVLTPLEPYLFLRKLNENSRFYKWPITICSCIGALVIYLMAQKWWKLKKQKEKNKQLKELQNKAWKERVKRRMDNSTDVTNIETLSCIICCENPREIILLPCGHVCVCVECAENLNHICPVCRQSVELLNPAFIS